MDSNLRIETLLQTPAFFEELRKLGVMTTPVTRIDDILVVGFNEEKLRPELGID